MNRFVGWLAIVLTAKAVESLGFLVGDKREQGKSVAFVVILRFIP